MDRYYICPVVGTGSEGNPFRAKASDADNVKRVSAVIESDTNGKPVHSWTVCRVDADDFRAVEAMDGVERLGARDKLNTALSLADKQDIDQKLKERGEKLDAKDTTPRRLLNRLIKRHYPHVKDVLEAFP